MSIRFSERHDSDGSILSEPAVPSELKELVKDWPGLSMAHRDRILNAFEKGA